MSTQIQLNLDLNYNQPKIQPKVPCPNCGFLLDEEVKTNLDLSINYIQFAVANAHSGGLGEQQRRIWGRIERKLDKLEDESSEINLLELEQAEVDFLKKSFELAKVPSKLSKYFVVLEEAFQETVKNHRNSEK